MKWIVTAAVLAALLTVSEAQAGRARCRSRTVCCTQRATGVTPCVSGPTVIESVSTVSRSVTRERSIDCAGGVCRQRTVTRSHSTAQFKADQLALRGQLFHLGGGFGGGSHEGIGLGSTPEQATAACCYWGQRTPIEIGTAQGENGMWYAVVLYQ